jgi:hypothetical protein
MTGPLFFETRLGRQHESYVVIRLDRAMAAYRASEVHRPAARFDVELLEDAARGLRARRDRALANKRFGACAHALGYRGP